MKFKALLAAVLAMPLALAAQTTNPTASVMQPATGPVEVAGQIYAANFAHWTASPTAEGLRWGTASQCYATSGGVTFPMFATNASIKVVDVGTPAWTETIKPSQVSYQGNGCNVSLPFTHPHVNYYLQSGTLGLQEAANWSGAQYATILVTPDWTAMGGTTAMLSAATLGANTTLQDERTNVLAYGPALDPTTYSGLMASYIGTSGSWNYMQIVAQDLNPNGSLTFVMGGDNMTNTTHYFDCQMNGSGSGRTSVNTFFINANAASCYNTDSETDFGTAMVTGTGVFNWYLAQATTPNMVLIPASLSENGQVLSAPTSIAGSFGMKQGTTNAAGTTNILHQAPTAVTSYVVTEPGVGPAINNQQKAYSALASSVTTETFIPATRKSQLTAQYANSTATPSTIWSFTVDASTNYHVICDGRYKAASTGAFELTLTGPATPTNAAYTFTPEVNLSAGVGTYLDYEVGIATTYPTSINAVAVTAAATDMSFHIEVDLNNVTAGTLNIQGNTIGTATLNVEIGSTCTII